MKNISLTLEQLDNGRQRITSRISGRTVCYKDADQLTKDDALYVLRQAAGGHEIIGRPGTFDLTYIELNAPARELLQF